MKKTFTYTLMLLMAAVTMVSCEPDPDADLAYDIEGVWEGTIDGDYYSRHYHTSDFYTEIEFVRMDAYGGYGYERDYRNRYSNGLPIGFDWTVKGGRIYLEYDDGYNVIISDYKVRMRDRLVFTGFFDDWDTGEQMASFRLYKIAEPTYDDYSWRTRGSQVGNSDSEQ